MFNFKFFLFSCVGIVTFSGLVSKNTFGDGIGGVSFEFSKRLDFLTDLKLELDSLTGVHTFDSGGEGLKETIFSDNSVTSSKGSKWLFGKITSALSNSSKNYTHV